MSSFTFCGNSDLSAIVPAKPLRVLVLTSVRDTGVCDRNGTAIETPHGPRYMEGAIERLVNASLSGGPLHGTIEVAGVITDDLPKDLEGSDYPVLPGMDPAFPGAGRASITPMYLLNNAGQLITTLLTHNIPSKFRELPKGDMDGRKKLKFEFERRVAAHMKFLNADVILSDHYMAKLEYLIASEEDGGFGLFGRVLNIHPAVTVEGHPHCFRGKTPTADAIAHARRQRGTILTRFIRFLSRKQAPATMTGATLHLIDKEIDHGPPIAYGAPTPVHHTDEPQWLRYRNYRSAKLPILVEGMKHYALNIFPHLENGLDVNALSAEMLTV